MAEPLRRFANLDSFRVLHKKLEKWLEKYDVNSCDENVRRCCEVIDTNSKIQSQLLCILGLIESEESFSEAIRTRLLPLLSQQGIVGSPPAQDWFNEQDDRRGGDESATDRESSRIRQVYEMSLEMLENDIRIARSEAEHLQHRLDVTGDELISVKRLTSDEKIFRETEIQKIRRRLHSLEEELASLALRGISPSHHDYESRRSEEHDSRKAFDSVDWTCVDSPRPMTHRNPGGISQFPKPDNITSISSSCQRLREEHLVERFLEMYNIDRRSTLNSISTHINNSAESHKIIFTVMQEAFAAAKLAFASYKMKVRCWTSFTRAEKRLEDAVHDCMLRNPDLHDLLGVTMAATNSLRRYLPNLHETVLSILQPFLHEAAKLAWNMQTLLQPMDVASAAPHETFDGDRYNRDFTSDYGVPAIAHHVWPCLLQGAKVIVKGEAITGRPTAPTANTERSRVEHVFPRLY